MNVGQRCHLVAPQHPAVLTPAFSSASSSSAEVVLDLIVYGEVTAIRRHADDPSRTLHFFRTTRLEWSGAQGSEKQRVLRSILPSTSWNSTGDELSVGSRAVVSAEGITYNCDGWYDEGFLVPCEEDEEEKEHQPEKSGAQGGAEGKARWKQGGSNSRRSQRSSLARKDVLSSAVGTGEPCELLYVCYAVRPWFRSEFDSLGYLAKPMNAYCYSVHICHRCLSPFYSSNRLQEHLAGYCHARGPPGTLLYDDRVSKRKVFLVDAAAHLHYCRCLALLGMCFVEHKTVDFDVDVYEFFVVTLDRGALPCTSDESDEASFRREAAMYDAEWWDGDVVVGFFSRIKHEPNLCLTCIATIPPFQQDGIGTFMLDFAYYVTQRRQSLCGCEARCGSAGGAVGKPFSPYGKRLLLSYWRKHIMRSLHQQFLKGQKQYADLEEIRKVCDIPIHMDDLRFTLLSESGGATGFCFYSSDGEEKGGKNGSQTGGANVASSTKVNVQSTAESAPALLGSLFFDGTEVEQIQRFRSERNGSVREQRNGSFDRRWLIRFANGDHLYDASLFHYE